MKNSLTRKSILLGLLFLTTFIVYHYRLSIVSGDSMYPTFKNGEIRIVKRLKDNTKIEKNMIVMLKLSNEKDYMVKRIIGIPYDLVNFSFSDRKWIIPENKYYVLGDNRNHSIDSRVYGLISRSEIVGIVK